MAAIRFPETAVPLLPLCKGHGQEFVFKTYADLISYIASYGFRLVNEEGHKLPRKLSFTDTPNPIPLEVFENRELIANFLIIALAHDETRQIAEDDELLTKLIEQHVEIGASVLINALSSRPITEWRSLLANALMEAPDSSLRI